MTSTINASTTGSGGVVTTADSSGILALQGGGVTGLSINANGAVGTGTSPSYGTAGQVMVSGGSSTQPAWGNVNGGTF